MEHKAHQEHAMAAILSMIAIEAQALADALTNQTDAHLGGAVVTSGDHIGRLADLQAGLEKITYPGRR
jgi:hypothetical protein